MNKIQLNLVNPSPHPIRKGWDEGKMVELAQSIREQGVIVPIKVRPIGDGYEIIYGHRRVEAAKRAGLDEIPAIVEDVENTDALVQALIENVQREDMHPLDVAYALRALMDATGAGTRDIERLGLMPHARVSHFVKLLDEEPEIQAMISKHEGGTKVTHKQSGNGVTTPALSETHVRSAREAGIKESSERARVLKKAANEELTYRETRQLADAYVAADTPELKRAVLDVNVKMAKTAEQVGYVARGMLRDPGMAGRVQKKRNDQKTQKKLESFDRAVAEFLEEVQGFKVAIVMAYDKARFGKFSPEAKSFSIRKLNALQNDINDLIEQLKE